MRPFIGIPRDASARRSRIRRGAFVVAVTVLTIAGAVGCSPSGSAPSGGSDGGLTPVRLAIVPVTSWLPAMVAADQGFFEDNGLDVQITNVTAPPNAALGRQFDIGSATATDVIQAVTGGLDLKLISTVAQETEVATALVVPGDSSAQSIEDLAGKRVGVPQITSAVAQSLKFLMGEANGDPDSILFQEMPFATMPDQLAAGQIDAVGAVMPFAGVAEAAGGRSLMNPVMEAARAVLGPDAAVTPLFAAATNEWVEANPDAIDGWVASLQAAADYIVENEEDARRILQEYTELPEAVADTTPLYGHDIGPVTAEQIGVWIEIVEGAGGLEQELEPEQFIVTS